MATNTGGNPYLDRVYAASGADDLRTAYDEWATSYDDDLLGEAQDYVGHEQAADAVAAHAGVTGTILDAGCGTGLVGAALARRGATTVDGVDLSPGMLDRARATGAYRNLDTADLTAPIAVEDDVYDVVVCAGTLTQGHVGPAVLGEFARITRPGGTVVATVLDDVWESAGYRAEVDRLAAGDVVEALATDVVPYRAGQGVDCRMLVLRVR